MMSIMLCLNHTSTSLTLMEGAVYSASSDLTGLGANVGVGRSWSYAKERTVPVADILRFLPSVSVQHFR